MGRLPFTLQGFSQLVYNFDSQLFPSVGALKSSCTSISGTVSGSKNSMSSAASGVASGWSSEAGVSVKSALQNPIIEGLNRIETSMNGSLLSIIGKIDALGAPVGEIKNMISTANTLKEGEWKEWTSIFGVKHKSYEKNDDDLIEKYYNSIKNACSDVESSINSLASASSESLGIVGNICGGTPLGSYNAMDLSGVNTDIAIAAINAESKSGSESGQEKSGFVKALETVGAFAVGIVESPLKLVEGIVDAGATLVADVVDMFGGDASGIVKFIKKDHVGIAVDSLMPFITEYDTARSIGNAAGELAMLAVASGAIGPVAGLGNVAKSLIVAGKAIGNAGRTSETVLGITNGNLTLATTAAVVVGVADAKVTRKLQKIFTPKVKPVEPKIAGHLPAPGDTVGGTKIAGNLPAPGDTVGGTKIAGNLTNAAGNTPDFSKASVSEILKSSAGVEKYTTMGENLGLTKGMSFDKIREICTPAFKERKISGGDLDIFYEIFGKK